jgi:hypothetical protein
VLFRMGRVVVPFLILALTGVQAGALASGKSTAQFSYNGPSAVAGAFDGSCEALGAILPPGEAALTTDGGTLDIRRTRVNYTLVSPGSNPVPLRDPDRQWEERIEFPAGSIQLAKGDGGVLTLQPYATQSGHGSPPPEAKVRFVNANFASVRFAVPSPAEFFWVSESGEKPHIRFASFDGWGRAVDFDGDAIIKSNLSFYLRESAVQWPVGKIQLGPWEAEESNVSSPIVAHRTVVFTDAFLNLRGAAVRLPPSTQLICGELQGNVRGSFVADRATGSVETESGRVDFADKVVSLEGSFDLRESPERLGGQEGAMNVRGEGQIRVVGVDFAAVAPTTIPNSAKLVGLGVVLLAAAYAAYKTLGTFVGAFYSRFGRDRALDNGNRDTIYQAIVQNPGVDLLRLRDLTTFHFSTVAYHVRVLGRVGLIDRLRHGHSMRLLPKEGGVNRVQVLAEKDRRFGFLVEYLSRGPQPLKEVVKSLAAGFGVSRQAAHLIVNRAVKRNIVTRTGKGRNVVIQCAS